MHGLKTNAEDMTNWLREGDVVFVDKCFRISLEFLDDLGIKTEMLVFLKKGQKQHMHTVEESYSSRSVTKIRWVVESVNGKLKCWKYLANVIPNSQIPYISEYMLFVCLMAFIATFNNISVISWRSVLLVEETGGPGEKPLTCRKSLTIFIN